MKIVLDIIKYLYSIYKTEQLDKLKFYVELENNTNDESINLLINKAKNTEVFKLLMGIYVHDEKKRELLTKLYLDNIIFSNSEPEILFRINKNDEGIVYLKDRPHNKINYIVPEIVGSILLSAIPISLLDIFDIYHMSQSFAIIYCIFILLAMLFIKPAFSILSIRNEEKRLQNILTQYNQNS